MLRVLSLTLEKPQCLSEPTYSEKSRIGGSLGWLETNKSFERAGSVEPLVRDRMLATRHREPGRPNAAYLPWNDFSPDLVTNTTTSFSYLVQILWKISNK